MLVNVNRDMRLLLVRMRYLVILLIAVFVQHFLQVYKHSPEIRSSIIEHFDLECKQLSQIMLLLLGMQQLPELVLQIERMSY